MSLARTPLGSITHQIINVEYDGGGDPIYIGYAEPGTADADPYWLIQKLTWSAGNMTALRFANGNLDYGDAWTGRAGLSYS